MYISSMVLFSSISSGISFIDEFERSLFCLFFYLYIKNDINTKLLINIILL